MPHRPGLLLLPLALALAAVAFLAAACSNRDPRPIPSPSPTYRTKVELAPIDNLELIIRESFPPQYAIKITSGLPSGCHQFDKAEPDGWRANTLVIRVTNIAPDDPDVACDTLYRFVESVIELGTDFVPREHYAVEVNGKRLDFTAQ
ncbi:MAG: hypothetical protein KJ048_01250 [Dehalococcoidia bacterium]|nr:hypothetical protein [Dehalococcoidia bacterium]